MTRLPLQSQQAVGWELFFWPVQLLLGHTKLESTVRYLGIEVDDALEIAEHMDI